MSEQQFLWNSLDGGENVFIKERSSDKIIHIKIIEGKYDFVEFMEKVNEQQATIDYLRQKKIKETKFVLDEKGIVEKISNKSYPRIHSDENDNPVRTLSCSNLFDLVDLLNEQQAEIERLKKELDEKQFRKLEEENDNMNLFIKQTIEPLLGACVFELNTIESTSQVELAEKIEEEIIPFIQNFKYLKYESLEDEKQNKS